MKKPPPSASDTICAPATAPGRAAIAIIRLSGPQSRDAVTRLAGALPPPRMARRARLRDPETGDDLDDGLVLWFPSPRSVTGEDVAEFHVHGGRAVVDGVMQA
ncbi:MAG: tRNA uridine-5-carboxymethylaminomethyl(34) synthesis GTPase MnmE, partial [Stellaceae bacterium]